MNDFTVAACVAMKAAALQAWLARCDNMDLDKYARLIAGIASGRRAYTGPYLVQLDLTNSCNTRCLYCMNYSGLGLKEEHPHEWMNTFLEFDIVERVIPELKSVGVKEVDVTGNGEPFMHPDIIKVIQTIKANGMRCVVRTNGLLIDRNAVDQLLEIGLDGIDLSLWAGSPEGYAEVHPEESQESFLRIKDWLQHAAELKPRQHGRKAGFKLKILNVIARPNHRRTEEMLSFACEVKADYVIFKPLLEEFFQDAALRQLALTEEDKGHLRQAWRDSAFKNRVRNNLRHFVKALDKSFKVNNCYFGWLYSRLTVTGEVIPCCGCLMHYMGDFTKHNFSDIWYGQEYDEFRRRSRHINSDKYFQDCSCTRTCPHYMPIIPTKDLWTLLR